ncbi:hypothetical protein [Mesorhizobium sp.]|nr:hypothetical protein [Mesorhizobium sp.]
MNAPYLLPFDAFVIKEQKMEHIEKWRQARDVLACLGKASWPDD